MLRGLFSVVGQMRGAASGISGISGSLSRLGSKASKSFRRFRKKGGVAGEVARLRMRRHLSIDSMGFVKGIAKAMEHGLENMANDVREKTVNYIMGNRKNPMNVYPKNVVNPKTGKHYKNSVARPWPQPPKSYVKPGDPISIAQVMYAKDTDTSKMKVQGGTIDAPKFVVGPIGTGRKSKGNKNALPGVLESGGTTKAFYRQVKQDGQIVRWEFVNTKKSDADLKKGRAKIVKGMKTPVRYSSWAEVHRIRRQRGEKIGGAITFGELQTNKFDKNKWHGPSTFRIKARPYVQRAWDKTKKRASKFIGEAKNVLPSYMAKTIKLRMAGKPRKRRR